MTDKDLQSVKFLKLELERNENTLRGLNGSAQAKEYIEVLNKHKAELLRKKAEIESLINGVNDTEIRLILKLKFVDLRSWNYIARVMHYDRSTVYKKYQKFIRGLENERV